MSLTLPDAHSVGAFSSDYSLLIGLFYRKKYDPWIFPFLFKGTKSILAVN